MTQGEAGKGSSIGYIEERFDKSDIGLVAVKNGIQVSNCFMDIDSDAKRLLPAAEINYGDRFAIDGYVTGQQVLMCHGICVVLRPESQCEEEESFNRRIQVVYAPSVPINKAGLRFREGVCGSALVRTFRRDIKEDVSDRGEIGGFMQYSELRWRSAPDGSLLCFVEALDDFIAAGWQVVNTP